MMVINCREYSLAQIRNFRNLLKKGDKIIIGEGIAYKILDVEECPDRYCVNFEQCEGICFKCLSSKRSIPGQYCFSAEHLLNYSLTILDTNFIHFELNISDFLL